MKEKGYKLGFFCKSVFVDRCTWRTKLWKYTFPSIQKEATGALTHAGAHLDLSAFSSWEVGELLRGHQNQSKLVCREKFLMIYGISWSMLICAVRCTGSFTLEIDTEYYIRFSVYYIRFWVCTPFLTNGIEWFIHTGNWYRYSFNGSKELAADSYQ